MKFTEAPSLLPLSNLRGSSSGATMVKLIQGLNPKKTRAGPWSMGPAAHVNVGSGFESHPWAQVPQGNELSILTPSKRHDGPTNTGKEAPIIGLMSLMSTLVANQNPVPEESMDHRAASKNIVTEEKRYIILLEDPANKLPSYASAILPPQNLGNLPF
ncbi:hypothetical protein DSO57_1031202 [Entomophthora muscae]|uniref:Uncharacterized protein n=1 Tax=Entomophthora muscae TaxID=34485 RepID=A0ACC2UB47_9FUNG|nr:hypothetical protein DSO57_1031202 [Entomophthora muscae]